MTEFPGGPYPQPQPWPQPARRRHTRWVLLGGIIGLVIGVVGVGLPWLLLGSGDSDFGGGSSAAMLAPASTDLLSQAYGGATAVVQQYATSDLLEVLTLQAVRARSPLPYVPYEDAARLELAVPPDQRVQVGDVYCVLYNQPTTAGAIPSPGSVTVTYCQRTGADLTVQIKANGALVNSPTTIAGLVNTAWAALS